MHAGGYGLTPADGQAQRAGPTGSQTAGVAWPVRAGLVPPLAESFTTRPETGPGLEAALIPETGSPGGGLLVYAIGLAAEWPFVSQPDYTGPLVKTLGGADISWLVGWVAAAIVCLLLVALVARHLPPWPADRRDCQIVTARTCGPPRWQVVRRSRPAGLGGGQQPGLDPVRLTPDGRGVPLSRRKAG